jgi:hypothetical protein
MYVLLPFATFARFYPQFNIVPFEAAMLALWWSKSTFKHSYRLECSDNVVVISLQWLYINLSWADYITIKGTKLRKIFILG